MHTTNRRRQNGMVLVLVLIVVAILSLAGMSFVMTMSTEHEAVHLHGDQLRLAGLTESGEQMLGAFFEQSQSARQEAGGWRDNAAMFRGVLVFEDKKARRRGRFSVVSPVVENDEVMGMRFGADNESARLNLAVLPFWDQSHPGAGRHALMNLPAMTERTADAILDWIDSDDIPREFGAESDYYAGLGVPYGPRNGTPASLEELLLVRGVTRELLLGADANFNHQLELEETQAAESRTGSTPSDGRLVWADMLTVHSAERNESNSGEPRVDINGDDLRQLHEQLSEMFDADWAEFIVLYRQFGPDEADPGDAMSSRARRLDEKTPLQAKSPSNRVKQPKQPKTAKRPLTAKTFGGQRGSGVEISFDLSLPAEFEIDSVLDLIGARVRIPDPDPPDEEAADEPDGESGDLLIESPFADDRFAMREYLPVLLDRTTTLRTRVIPGRVNVNLAPRAVLVGVPGLDRTMVERIVAMRRATGEFDDPVRRHPTWLLGEGLVDREQMRAMLPYLTCGGDVFRAQIVGYFDEGGAASRVELILDATSSPPRRVYWKDLRLFGHGYPTESLGAQSPGLRPVD